MKTGVRVPHNGETVDAVELDFSVAGDGVIVISAEDGTLLEISHKILSVYRLEGKMDPQDGTPLYVVIGGSKIVKTMTKPVEVN